jgi:outer membrane protein assembly factor BamB
MMTAHASWLYYSVPACPTDRGFALFRGQGEDGRVASGLSRRRLLFGAGSLVAGAIATAGCAGTRGPAGAPRRPKPGTLRWRTAVPGSVLAVAETAGMLCVASGSGLRGLSTSSGKQSWSLTGRQGSYLNVMGAGGKVFIVSSPSAAAALDPVTGRQRWRFDAPRSTGLANAPLFTNDGTTVYATGMTADTGRPQSYILAIDAFTGGHKWTAYFPPTPPIGPITAGDGVVCALLGPDPVKLIAFDAQTGAHKWTAPGPAVPLQGVIGDGVLFGPVVSAASKSGVVALDVATGNVAWSADVGGNLWGTDNDAGIAYASTFDGPAQDGVSGDLIALDARTGRRLWRRHFPEGAPTDLAPAGAVVCTGIDSGTVHALDSATGRVLWSYQVTEAPQDQLSAIVPTSGAVYLANLKGALFALQA